MPLFRWVRDLGRPRVPGAYGVRNSIVRVTERDIVAAEEHLRTGQSDDVVFVSGMQRSPSEISLASIMPTPAAAEQLEMPAAEQPAAPSENPHSRKAEQHRFRREG